MKRLGIFRGCFSQRFKRIITEEEHHKFARFAYEKEVIKYHLHKVFISGIFVFKHAKNNPKT